MAGFERRIEPERVADKYSIPIGLIRRNDWRVRNRLNDLTFAKQHDVHHQIALVTVFIYRIVEVVGVIEIGTCWNAPHAALSNRFIRIDCSQNNS